jgi:RNA recognition motif-containing protein
MNVLISNPERKKERSDADAHKRELYVAGLSKSTTKSDLESIFKPVRISRFFWLVFVCDELVQFGELKDVRMALGNDGSSKGFAFVEFVTEVSLFAFLICIS